MSLTSKILMELPFTERELNLLIISAPRRYKEYWIPKRNGQQRLIAQPTPEIKLLQRWLIKNYLSGFPVHAAATAYRQGIGLKENVLPHLRNRYMLKLDFEGFFPSLKSSDLINFLKDEPIDQVEINMLAQLLFKKADFGLELAVGAPSSPPLSNILMYEFDDRVNEYCTETGISYTRYADDLTFSTSKPHVLRGCLQFVTRVLADTASPKLRLNAAKTVETSKKRGRRVTGLGISTESKISIGRNKKRDLRVLVHRFTKGELSAEEIQKLRGYFAFLISVEPEHLDRLAKSFGVDVMLALTEGN
ncbi:MAG TPA: retron St85 family RNA-directed DNA polymerase [Pusillimonas sp.]|uniref:retron St85 family RNA-directed DNA polymerase n=1 Tax=Pusillimonas sp. TaxID=3040095 RepID=UPI002C2EE2C3|nr:retron St85 family RNA-directed DNA polymerase [Pusillimonas sp.]HUH88249.1 retron St85 family RNA-directed DNA polymerase [Pusillimonas sp.]